MKNFYEFAAVKQYINLYIVQMHAREMQDAESREKWVLSERSILSLVTEVDDVLSVIRNTLPLVAKMTTIKGLCENSAFCRIFFGSEFGDEAVKTLSAHIHSSVVEASTALTVDAIIDLKKIARNCARR